MKTSFHFYIYMSIFLILMFAKGKHQLHNKYNEAKGFMSRLDNIEC